MSTRMHVGDVSHLGSNRHSFFSMDGTQQSPQLWLGPETEVAAELDGNSFPAVPVFSPKAQRRYQNSFSIKMLPYTTNEWKKALADIKRDYTNKRYRPCSTRCAELLQNVQHPESIQPTYLIYLRFYAASSLEMQVRGFQTSSPHRLRMLHEARNHYQIAAELARAADEQVNQIKSYRAVSPTSSLDSPVTSIMSAHSAASTRMSSPTPSVGSTTQISDNPGTKKKRVAFLEDLIQEPVSEPFVRPDSPTLGLDDPASGRSSPCFENIGLMEDTSAMPTPTASEPQYFPVPPQSSDDHLKSSAALERYCLVLSSIQRQIRTHLASIDNDIEAATNTRHVAPIDEEMRALELQSRIERLRACGWQRKRFDVKRYENFRERAMADML